MSSAKKKKGLKLDCKSPTHVTVFPTGLFVLHLQLSKFSDEEYSGAS